MHKLLRLYNQNIFKFWLSVLVIIFVIFIIQFFNREAAQKTQNNTKEEETVSNTVSSGNNEKSIITENKASEKYKNEMEAVVKEFYDYCINDQPNRAYDLLSAEMKKEEYPNESIFKNLYYKDKFENKQYSFQSWYSNRTVEIYVVKIFEDMLSTGKQSNSEYIEEYITVVPEEDTFKINLNGFVGERTINERNENDFININVHSVKEYIDYAIYTCEIKNNTNDKIFFDTKKKGNTIYLLDEKNIKFKSYLYENKSKDFELEPKEFKTIKIKFNIEYGKKIESINFDNIVIDNNDNEKNECTLKVEI